MKQAFILFLLLGVPLVSFGQKLYPLNVLRDSLVFESVYKDHVLVLDKKPESSVFNLHKDFPRVLDIRIEEADLVLEFKEGGSKDASSYTFDLALLLPDGRLVSMEPGSFDYRADPHNNTRNLVWRDAAEWILETGFTYKLIVQRSLMGPVNCESGRPVFSLQKKLPYYGVAGAGVVLVGLGQVYRLQKNDYYRLYKQRWVEGAGITPDQADNPRQNALKKEDAYLRCTWVGIGLLLTDGLLFTRKSISFKRKQRLYDTHCGGQPSLGIKSSGSGLGLSLKF